MAHNTPDLTIVGKKMDCAVDVATPADAKIEDKNEKVIK